MKSHHVSSVVAALPRPDVPDCDLLRAIADCGGLPSRVADSLSMSLADLLARAKASPAVAAAFLTARQRQVDAAKIAALKVALGSPTSPPDPQMLRWFIERYEP